MDSKKKKIRSFNDLVKAMQPTSEELKYRKEKSEETDFVQKYSKLFKCTKCQLNLKPIIESEEKVPVHPCLGVLMCQNCCNYYEDGEFSLDSDGEDKYCRWCGEGGTIFSCSKCICGFCAACIKRHFKLEYFKQVQKDENWLCFFCNPKPLWDQRIICSLAKQLSKNVKTSSLPNSKANYKVTDSCEGLNIEQNIQEAKTNVNDFKRIKPFKSQKRKIGENQSSIGLKNLTSSPAVESSPESQKTDIFTSSSDDSDFETPAKKSKCTSTPLKKNKKESSSFKSLKSNVLSELKKILLLTEHQMDFGMNWSKKTVDKLKFHDIQTPEELLKECKKVKWFLSTLSTYLVEFSNSVGAIEKKLYENDGLKNEQNFPNREHQSDYSKILQFLNFVRNQVKTFMEKGISFPDVLEAEVYDDKKIIGIKKKQYNETSSHNISKTPVTKCNFKNNDDSPEDKDSLEGSKVNEFDKSRDEFLDLVVDEIFDNDNELGDEDKGQEEDSSSTTVCELSELKNVDPREDIRQILAILENA